MTLSSSGSKVLPLLFMVVSKLFLLDFKLHTVSRDFPFVFVGFFFQIIFIELNKKSAEAEN